VKGIKKSGKKIQRKNKIRIHRLLRKKRDKEWGGEIRISLLFMNVRKQEI
jgi:hypothetical protein